MKKLVKKYCEMYPDGYLSQFFSVLIENNMCEEEIVKAEFKRLKDNGRIEIEEAANFERLVESYEQI